MTVAELAVVIGLLCGHQDTDASWNCRDFMVNCAVQKDGEIKKEKVEECESKARYLK